jgi:DNA-binding transcriptional ArsR family regulator
MPEPEILDDPRVLRALAHPVRGRILDEIEASGPVRAADVARELGIPANQASFHLRQLAKYGLVEEAPEEARDKRDRVWRAVDRTGMVVSLSKLEDAPGGRAAVEVFRRQKRAWGHQVVDRALATDHPKGSGVFSLADHALKLTDDEAKQLFGEVEELVEAWGARTRGREPGRRTYTLVQIIQPHVEGDGTGEGGARP